MLTVIYLTLASGDIKKHFDSPISSSNKICLKNCEHEKPVKKVMSNEVAAENPLRKASVIPIETMDQLKVKR